jgi:hypothetical protein
LLRWTTSHRSAQCLSSSTFGFFVVASSAVIMSRVRWCLLLQFLYTYIRGSWKHLSPALICKYHLEQVQCASSVLSGLENGTYMSMTSKFIQIMLDFCCLIYVEHYNLKCEID